MKMQKFKKNKYKDRKSWFHSSTSLPSFRKVEVRNPVTRVHRSQTQAMLGLRYYKPGTQQIGTGGTVRKGLVPFRKTTGFRRTLMDRWNIETVYGLVPRRFFQTCWSTFEKKMETQRKKRAERIHRNNRRMEWKFQRGLTSGKAFNYRKLFKHRKENCQKELAQKIVQKHVGVEISMARRGRRFVPVALPTLPRRSVKRVLRDSGSNTLRQELILSQRSRKKPWWPKVKT